MRKTAIAVIVIGLAAGNIGSAQAQDSIFNAQTLGGVLGGIGGAVAGAQIGHGKGKLVSVAAGSLLGAFAGTQIAQRLTGGDQHAANAAAYNALDTAPRGQPVAWSNPDTGNRGSITPSRSYMSDSGASCRDYTQQIVIDGESQRARGTACKQSDGTWRIANAN